MTTPRVTVSVCLIHLMPDHRLNAHLVFFPKVPTFSDVSVRLGAMISYFWATVVNPARH